VPLADSSQLGLRLYLLVTVLLLYYIRTIPSLCHSIVILLNYTRGWFKVLHCYRFLYRRRCFLHSLSTATAVFSILLIVGTLLRTTSNRTHSGLLFVPFLITLHSRFFFSSILSLSNTGASRRLPSAPLSPPLLAGDCVAVILYKNDSRSLAATV
jgi:hypothetical protein